MIKYHLLLFLFCFYNLILFIDLEFIKYSVDLRVFLMGMLRMIMGVIFIEVGMVVVIVVEVRSYPFFWLLYIWVIIIILEKL
jgi:hypothetical protein